MEPLILASTHYGRVLLGIIVLTLVIALGTAGYMLIEGWSFLDAFYMTAITITTVGYREVGPLSRAGQLFTVVLLFVGVGTAFYILTAFVAAIIEGDLGQLFGARRMRVAIERIRDHYIVCGFGRVGEEIARELTQRRAAFTIVDLDQEVVTRARAAGYLAVHGDATLESVLREAGIERCRAIIAASDSDPTNVYITLTAKSVRPDVFVVARVSTPAVEAKMRQAGANRVISPYSIGGRHLAMAAVQPIMSDFIDIVPTGPADTHDGRILAEFLIDQASGLAGKTLAEALADCGDVVALAVRDAEGRMTVGPATSTPLTLGDRLMVVGDEAQLRSIGAIAPS